MLDLEMYPEYNIRYSMNSSFRAKTERGKTKTRQKKHHPKVGQIERQLFQKNNWYIARSAEIFFSSAGMVLKDVRWNYGNA